MVFIVSDQRIATENFEKGKIYKVVFLDESIFYGVCLGIGSNFVMLSGNISGYLFPLTMETASQVESIDLFDPTPPEPPVPWTNLLQYQTGDPPFTFNTTDDQLFSWYITGAGVGDKTANLCTGYTTPNTQFNIYIENFKTIIDTVQTFTLSFDSEITYAGNTLYLITDGGNTVIGYVAGKGHVVKSFSFNSTQIEAIKSSTNAYIRLYVNGADMSGNTNIMLNTGSTALPYEPYGYKIPILCNEHLTNIYLDAPLDEGEILYSTDVDTVIITDIGDNTLSVLTEAQPSEMQIVYKIADR